MKKLKNFLFLSIYLFQSAILVNTVLAAGWVLPANPGGLPNDFDQVVLNITNWLLGLAALAGVLAFVWGGINYIGSSGDTQKADLSKRIIYYASIGLFIAAIGYAIVRVMTTVIFV